MNKDEFPIWMLGEHDELIRQHLDLQDLSVFQKPEWWRPKGPSFAAAPPQFGPVPVPKAEKKKFSLRGKGAVEAYDLGKKVYEFGEVAWQFGIGPDGKLGRFTKNMSKDSKPWQLGQWKSLEFEGTHDVRKALRPPIKGREVPFGPVTSTTMHHKTIAADSPTAQKLSLGVFSAKGLWKGVKSGLWWDVPLTVIGMGAEATVLIYDALVNDRGWQPLRDYIFSLERLKELAHAIAKSIITTLTTMALTALATAAGITVIPAAVGLVVGVGVGCAYDTFVMGEESICEAGWRWLTEDPPAPPPPPPTPPVLKAAPPKPTAPVNTPMT